MGADPLAGKERANAGRARPGEGSRNRGASGYLPRAPCCTVIMSLTHFCPACWKEVAEVPACPACGADLRRFQAESYEQKLIRALRHPEPTVPVRAATILGELGSRAGVEPLMEVASTSADLYIQEAAVIALGRIGDARAGPLLASLSRQGALRVRMAADQALKDFDHECRSQQS
jgi:HEAT repeats